MPDHARSVLSLETIHACSTAIITRCRPHINHVDGTRINLRLADAWDEVAGVDVVARQATFQFDKSGLTQTELGCQFVVFVSPSFILGNQCLFVRCCHREPRVL